MSSPITADMMRCYMLRCYQVRPELSDNWSRQFPQCRMIWERHGARCLGQWQMCLGGECSFMMLLEYPNAAAATQCQIDVRGDPEYIELCRACYNCLDNISCPLLRCMPMVPMCSPNPRCNIVLMRYTLRTLPCLAMKDCQMYVERFMERFGRASGMRMIGCFCPCYYSCCNEIYIMLEIPQDNTTTCVTRLDEYSLLCCTDASWCEQVMPFYNHCSNYSMQMLNCCM